MKFCSFLFHIYNYAIDTLFKIWSSTLYRKKAVNALSQLNRFHKMTNSDIFCAKKCSKKRSKKSGPYMCTKCNWTGTMPRYHSPSVNRYAQPTI